MQQARGMRGEGRGASPCSGSHSGELRLHHQLKKRRPFHRPPFNAMSACQLRAAISLPSFCMPMRICSGGTVTKLNRIVFEAGVLA